MEHTAYSSYGFASYGSPPPGSAVAQPSTTIGNSDNTKDKVPGISLPDLPFGLDNPLIWLLGLFLVWTGYLFGSFNIGVRNIGRVGGELG